MRYRTTILFFLSCFYGQAQMAYTPYVGLNSTRTNDNHYGYGKGGNFGFAGLEVEAKLRRSGHRPIQLSLVSGFGYLANGYNDFFNFSASSFFYSSKTSELKTRYAQIPLSARINWQPFPLVEEWKLFFDAGVVANVLMKATLSETAIEIEYGQSFTPPKTTTYSDRQDITRYGKKVSLFSRFQFGMKYKRFQLAGRINYSLGDTYFTGLENNWNVPKENSIYLRQHETFGQRKEKFVEVLVGYRIR
jgi:hypothetical protein